MGTQHRLFRHDASVSTRENKTLPKALRCSIVMLEYPAERTLVDVHDLAQAWACNFISRVVVQIASTLGGSRVVSELADATDDL